MEDFCKITYPFNEDYNQILFALYDGHSGSEVAKQSMEKFPDIFKTCLKYYHFYFC